MNALVQALPLIAMRPTEGKPALVKLISAYPEPFIAKDATHAEKMKEARIAAYLMAFEGLPGWSLDQSVKDFIQGRVERRRRDIMPTAEEVAAKAREHVHSEASRQMNAKVIAEQLQEQKDLAAREAYLRTPEGKAEAERKRQRAIQIMQGVRQESI